jgi:hypothetical protein
MTGVKTYPRKSFAWIAAMLITGGSASAKPNTPFYLSSKGPSATIVAYSGLDSPNALIIGQIQLKDAREFCHRDPGGDTVKYGGRLTFSQCVNQVLSEEKGKKYHARANCQEGRIFDPRGDLYILKQKKQEGSYRDYIWIDAKSGSVLDGSSASGATVITELYKVLCATASR